MVVNGEIDMVTVNGQPITDFLDKLKGDEIKINYHHEIYRSSVDNKTRLSSYATARRAVNRKLHDTKQKHGKTKVYTHGEIKIMQKLETFSDTERAIYDIINDSKQPISIKSIMYFFNRAYPNIYSKKSRQTFVTIIDNFVKEQLVKKLCIIKGEVRPHTKASRLYLLALPPHEVKSASTATPNAEVAEEAESQPAGSIKEAVLTADIHNTINDWMDNNDITEFSIVIKKR